MGPSWQQTLARIFIIVKRRGGDPIKKDGWIDGRTEPLIEIHFKNISDGWTDGRTDGPTRQVVRSCDGD